MSAYGIHIDNAGGDTDFATAAETSTGTETAKAVTPDGLAGSIFGEQVFGAVVVDFTTDVATGDGKFYFHIDDKFDGMNLVRVHAELITAGTTGTMDIQVHNLTKAQNMLSTAITIDSGETGSDTAAVAAVIDTGADDVSTNDLIRVDVDAIHTTAGKGFLFNMVLQLP